jgi:transposase
MEAMETFLSTEERDELRARHRRERDRRTADRIKAILLSDEGWSLRQIAKALLLDEETISRHVTDYIEKKKLSIQTGGSCSKLNQHQTQELTAHLEETTYSKVIDICKYVKNHYGIIYTVAGMTSWLRKQGFSYKKPKPVPAKADTVKQAEFIKAYEDLLTATPKDEPILFLDGVHPTMATKISYGWIKKGKDKLIKTTASRTRMNIMGTLNLKTMNVDVKFYQTINSESMVDYWAYLRSRYPDAPRLHIILDCGPYNCSNRTRESAEKYGIVLHHLPAYSPNLNPIERLWKVMNEHVRNNRFFNSAQEFKESILNFFDHTWNTISQTMTDRINDNFQTFQKSLVSG